MLYLGIDQHRRRLTVNFRDKSGTVVPKRLVGIRWEKVRGFLRDVQVHPFFPFFDVYVASLQSRAESGGSSDRRAETRPHFR